MVLVPIQRVTRRLLSLFAIILAVAALLLFVAHMNHVYQQHQKFKRLKGYDHFVDDVTNDLVKLEAIANQSNFSLDRLYSILGQKATRTKPDHLFTTYDRSNGTDRHVIR